jgi:hypothetical protein
MTNDGFAKHFEAINLGAFRDANAFNLRAVWEIECAKALERRGSIAGCRRGNISRNAKGAFVFLGHRSAWRLVSANGDSLSGRCGPAYFF